MAKSDQVEVLPPLTPLQKRFVDAYVGNAGGSAFQAAQMAGYSQGEQGYKVLQLPAVQVAIDLRTFELQKAGGMTPVEIHRFWRGVLENENHDIAVRLRASELAAKALGMFISRTENVNHNFDHGQSVDSVQDFLGQLDSDELEAFIEIVQLKKQKALTK